MMPLATRARSVTHPPEVGGVGVEGGGDGAFERDGSVGVEQLDESADEDAEVVVALGGGDEQGLGRGGGVVEAVGGAVLAGETFVAFELFDVGGVLDLLAAVEGAGVGGKHGAGVEDAHGVQRVRPRLGLRSPPAHHVLRAAGALQRLEVGFELADFALVLVERRNPEAEHRVFPRGRSVDLNVQEAVDEFHA